MASDQLLGSPVRFSGMDTITEEKIPQDVTISGMCKIPHNFECGNLRISGSVEANGTITCNGEMRNSGMFQIAGDLLVGAELRCSGLTRAACNVTAQGEVRTSGVFHVGGGLVANTGARLAGSTTVEHDAVIRGEFVANGLLKVKGHLIVDAGAVKVTCIGIPSIFGKWGRSGIGGSVVTTDRITLRNVTVDGNVFGTVVNIQRGTKVAGIVYFTDTVEVSEKANLAAAPVKISVDQLMQTRASVGQAENVPADSSEGVPAPVASDGSLTPKEVVEMAEATGETPAPSRMILYCPQCGSRLKNPVRFCPFCGLKIAD